MPSKSIKNSCLSKAPFCVLQINDPLSSRLYQIAKPSRSQKRAFMQLRCRLRNTKRAPVSSSPGKSCSIIAPSPSKLLCMLMGSLHRKIRVGRVSIIPPQIRQRAVLRKCGSQSLPMRMQTPWVCSDMMSVRFTLNSVKLVFWNDFRKNFFFQ